LSNQPKPKPFSIYSCIFSGRGENFSPSAAVNASQPSNFIHATIQERREPLEATLRRVLREELERMGK
jgi:hypothetical protein